MSASSDYTNGTDNARISLRIILLVGLLAFQVLTAYAMLEMATQHRQTNTHQGARLQVIEQQHAALEVQMRQVLEAFSEQTWMLSRPVEARPRLEVPQSLWRKLNDADREALSREIRREPIHDYRGKRRPTDG